MDKERDFCLASILCRKSTDIYPKKSPCFLAKELNLPPVKVYSVASFYSMFSIKEIGKFVIRVCVSLPCYLRGSREILQALTEELDISAGQTTADKKFTIEAVSCLGACDKAPAMMINETVYENLTPTKAKKIIKRLHSTGKCNA